MPVGGGVNVDAAVDAIVVDDVGVGAGAGAPKGPARAGPAAAGPSCTDIQKTDMSMGVRRRRRRRGMLRLLRVHGVRPQLDVRRGRWVAIPRTGPEAATGGWIC